MAAMRASISRCPAAMSFRSRSRSRIRRSGSRRRGARRPWARLGMGSVGFGFETPEELGERAEEYYRLVREELMPIGQAINPALAVLNTFMMADTDEEAMRRSANGPAFFSYSLGYYYNPAVG